MTNLDCTIIILSYNALKITDTCLKKVENAIEQSKKVLKNNICVIVVDNASVDGSAEMIRKNHPTVELIALKENIGYAAGNNLAMKLADTPYILLMNSDTYIKEDSLVESVKILDSKAHCDILVGRCIYANGVLQLYGGYLPSPLKIILWSFGFESIPIVKNYAHRIYGFAPDYYNHDGVMEWCPPNFFLLKKKVYDLTKGLDEKLWFHMVDVEWCHRIKKYNLVICFTPKIEVVHLGGSSSKGLENNLIRDNFRGLMHFCKKHYPHSVKNVSFYLRIGLKIRGFFYQLLGNQTLAEVYNKISKEI